MGSETIWGLGSLIFIVALILYALWQGSKVKKHQENVPGDRSGDLMFWNDPR